MNNSICSKCGKSFCMGIDGVFLNDADMCDQCAETTRTKSGEAYQNCHAYELRRPIANCSQGGARVRPGDFAVVHPNRKK